MPEESKESKSQKLAAARKKLKEYQQRSAGSTMVSNINEPTPHSGQVSSNISERSLSETQLNGSNAELTATLSNVEDESNLEGFNFKQNPTELLHNVVVENSFKPHTPTSRTENENTGAEGAHKIDAIQVLINEKGLLTTELSKCRAALCAKELDAEQLQLQNSNVRAKYEEMQNRYAEQQKQADQQRLQNAELQHKLAQASALNEDHTSHVEELQKQLTASEAHISQLKSTLADKLNELELSQLRVRQLSDESSATKDNRVETLTQTQYMYEQQIRDLQAMVQQLNVDKDQANTQYQTYVQQLNAQVLQLNERNAELLEEVTKLQEREKQLVDHVQQLEREIQKNIIRQEQFKEENAERERKDAVSTDNDNRVKDLQERIDELEFERHEFQLKIKSQEDRLEMINHEFQQKQTELANLQQHLERIQSEQPDTSKLLAAMESDKVAAARALTQNVELKKQLDELELRFVQLTNDKAELMNRLDTEQYSNREIHANYTVIEERLRTTDEKFKFKDEEMIRLSNENEELKRQNILLQQQMERQEHYEIQDGHELYEKHQVSEEPSTGILGDHGPQNEMHHHCQHDHEDREDHQHSDQCDSAHEVTEGDFSTTTTTTTNMSNDITNSNNKILHTTISPYIATEEAVEKLQQRFTQLMSQVAELSDEKQRLEHLVLQLQGETETIGEYIALYQTQRRMLKQREYERAAQTQLLRAERQQMRERLTLLNSLFSSLGVELPDKQQQEEEQQQQQRHPQQHAEQHSQPQTVTHTHQQQFVEQPLKVAAKDLNTVESQQILHKIHHIITEIKENTKELPAIKHNEDQLPCCLGKFEVV